MSSKDDLRHSSQEILNSWLKTEAVEIQEGNFLASLSRFSRTLLSSRIVTSVALLSESRGHLDMLVNYGDVFDVSNLCERPMAEAISSCTRGFFHEIVLYRPQISNQKLLLAFESKPSTAHAVFWSIFLIMSLVAACFMWVLAFALKKESDERLFLVKTAIEDLIRDAKPSKVLVRDFPTIIEMWQEIHEVILKLKKDIEKSSRLSAFAEISQQIGHDFRHPLGVFEALISAPDEDLPKMRRSVRDALARLNAMVESLRYSDIEQIFKIFPTDLQTNFILEAHERKASSRHICLSISEKAMPLVTIDAGKVERSLNNLVSNAIDAASSMVYVELDISGGSDLILRVKDDGPGIPDEFLPRLFQRGATYGKTDGTGLGLAYVKQIMQGHGGDVFYRRENGLTIFECHLPNAVIGKEEKAMELSLQTEMSLKQVTPKRVSICVEPPSVAKEILSALASRTSSKFTFTENYSFGATDVVVTNNPEMAARILEEDGEVEIAEYQPNLSEELLRARILRRFES